MATPGTYKTSDGFISTNASTIGGGGGDLPDGTEEGQIPRWNDGAGEWTATSEVKVGAGGDLQLSSGMNAQGPMITKVIPVTAATYQILDSDHILSVSGATNAVDLTMPPSPTNGQTHHIRAFNIDNLVTIKNVSMNGVAGDYEFKNPGDALYLIWNSAQSTWENYSHINPLYPNPRDPVQVVYDDLATSPAAIEAVGAASPLVFKWKDNGEIPSGPAIQLDGDNDRINVPYYAAMDSPAATQNMTFSFWMKTFSQESRQFLVRRPGAFELQIRDGQMTIDWEGIGERRSPSIVFVLNQRHHVVVRFAWDALNSEMVSTTFIDNVPVWTEVWAGAPPTTDSSDMTLGRSTNSLNGAIDAFVWYNVALTDGQISELYNGSSGTLSHPIGIVETTDVVAQLPLAEGAGATTTANTCTLGTEDGELQGGAAWITPGLIAGTGGTPSFGVIVKGFDKRAIRPISIERQFPHKKKVGAEAPFHVHWSKSDTQAGNVVWYVEYSASPVAGTFGNTTIERGWIPIPPAAAMNKDQHCITEICVIPGAAVDPLSGIVLLTLYRDIDHPDDTYPGIAIFHSADFHIPTDKSGSREPYAQ